MSITRLHERLERIEAAYLAALAGRDFEIVPSSVLRAAIFAAVPDASHEEIIEMFNWRKRKADRRADESERRADKLLRELRERKW
jgi:phosphoserine aminotransferase